MVPRTPFRCRRGHGLADGERGLRGGEREASRSSSTYTPETSGTFPVFVVPVPPLHGRPTATDGPGARSTVQPGLPAVDRDRGLDIDSRDRGDGPGQPDRVTVIVGDTGPAVREEAMEEVPSYPPDRRPRSATTQRASRRTFSRYDRRRRRSGERIAVHGQARGPAVPHVSTVSTCQAVPFAA